MEICDHASYKTVIRERIQSMPGRGRGESRKIASHLRMHTSRFSRILNGPENLTSEQATSLARYLGFSDFETDYFLGLLNLERAGSEELRKHLRRQLGQLKAQGKKLEKRLESDRTFSEQEQALFYSQWFYSGIRLLTSLEGPHSIDSISARLDLPRSTVSQVVNFLVNTGLCTQTSGELKMGPVKTHLPADSPMIGRLHANWRIKAIERHARLTEDELALTAPMSVPLKEVSRIRAILVQAIERAIKIASGPEQPEALACLNIDWFRF